MLHLSNFQQYPYPSCHFRRHRTTATTPQRATVSQSCCQEQPSSCVVRALDTHWLSMNAFILFKDDIGEDRKLRSLLNYFREDSSQVVSAGSHIVLAMVGLIKLLM
jgi:hypothetical protein